MSFFQIMSQNDSIQKTNPIIYFEASAGVARLNSDISTNVNFTGIYQKNKDLLTFRFSESSVINGRLIIFFPIVVQETINSEFAFLYGRRWLQDNSSTSLSIMFLIAYPNLRMNTLPTLAGLASSSRTRTFE